MVEMDTDDLRICQLAILSDVDKFCEENGLRYFLCGGTLLGAIRHGGFIPWDDDIDIAMPRPDYERFISTYNNVSKNYRVDGIENNANWHMPFARIGDKRTQIIEYTLKKKYRELLVFIDLFPIDGIPNTKNKENKLLIIQKFLGIIANASAFAFTPSKHFSDSKIKNVSFRNKLRTIVKYVCIILFRFINTQSVIRLINSKAKELLYDDCKEVGITVAIWNWKFEKASKLSFSERLKVKFENREFYIPKGYDEYLTKTYGDYMTPPPTCNQVSHHNFKAFHIR